MKDYGDSDRFTKDGLGQGFFFLIIVPVGLMALAGIFGRQHNVFEALAADHFHVQAENSFDQSYAMCSRDGLRNGLLFLYFFSLFGLCKEPLSQLLFVPYLLPSPSQRKQKYDAEKKR